MKKQRTAFAMSQCAALILLSTVAVAQDAQPAGESQPTLRPTNAKELIKAAYQKTQNAKTLEDFSDIVELCERALGTQLSPQLEQYTQHLKAWGHNRRGEYYAEQGGKLVSAGQDDKATEADETAFTEFETAIKLRPNYWKALHNRGVSFALKGKYEEASKDFSQAIELQPNYANAWFNRGEIYFESGEFEKAFADYSKTIELKPDDIDAYMRRGHACLSLGKITEALSDYNKVTKLNPKNAEAYAYRADLHRSIGQWEEAANDYREAISLDAKLGRAYQGAAWMMATCPDAKYRNASLAIQTAKRAITLDGKGDYQYLDALAAAYANAGRFAEAKAALDDALKVAPDQQQTVLLKRKVLYAEGKPFRQIDRVVRTASRGQ